MNNYNPNDFKYHRTDPYKHGYWEEDNTNWAEVIISTICIIVAFAAIGLVLFLN